MCTNQKFFFLMFINFSVFFFTFLLLLLLFISGGKSDVSVKTITFGSDFLFLVFGGSCCCCYCYSRHAKIEDIITTSVALVAVAAGSMLQFSPIPFSFVFSLFATMCFTIQNLCFCNKLQSQINIQFLPCAFCIFIVIFSVTVYHCYNLIVFR